MNHVQILHSGEMQLLHSIYVQDLPPGSLKAKNSRRPACEIFRLARVQLLHSGVQGFSLSLIHPQFE